MADERICTIDGCGKRWKASGLCSMHYERQRKHGDPLYESEKLDRRCTFSGCTKPHEAKGFCNQHYKRLCIHGDPSVKLSTRGEAQEFLEFAVGYEGQDCLEWPYYRNEFGYGRINGKASYAHRAVCIQANGPPPSRIHEAAHSCGNSSCVNPHHIRWDTPKGNQADRLIHGTDSRGEKSGMAKLTEREVREIRKLRGTVGHKRLARRYGVAKTTIRSIWKGQSWAWLD